MRDDGVAALLADQVDPAIAELSRAAELAPASASLWSDLAAAHLQRSVVASDPHELILALATANRAVDSDATLTAARFNRAIALERLSLRARATAEWRLVLRLEHDRLWAREAQEHAEALGKPSSPPEWANTLSTLEGWLAQGKPQKVQAVVAESPQDFREYLEDRLLCEWATAENDQRRSEAGRKLALAKAIADALVATGGDRMPADTIAQIERTYAADSAALRELSAGFIAYSKGLAFLERNLFTNALTHFQMAQTIFSRQRNPFALWAAYRMALCRYQMTDYRPSGDLIQVLLAQDLQGKPYQALQGRAFLLMGLIDAIEGRQTASIRAYEASLAAFLAAKETPLAAKMSGILADDFRILGQYQKAWSTLYPALMEPATFGRPEIRSALFWDASNLAQEQGETEIALWFQDEMLTNLQLLKRPEGIIGALCRHASLLASLGKSAAAVEDLVQARLALKQITGPAFRRGIKGDLLMAEAELAANGSPREVIAKLNEAIPILHATSYFYRIGQAYYERALAKMTLGQKDAAEHDFAAAIAESERQRDMIGGAGARVSYLDRMKEIFDAMIGLQLERGRSSTALRYSEQAKARVLWDWMLTRPIQEAGLQQLQSTPSPPFDLSSLPRGLPEGTAVIEYAVLPRRTVVWVLHRHGDVWSESLEVSAETLSDLVQRLRRALLNRNPGEAEAISKDLYDKVIRPVASHIAPGERLVLIPDGALHTLPFVLLRDRLTGRYLIQDHACAVAPSARIYVASLRRDRELAQRPEGHVLVVSAPDFDTSIDSTLLPLKAAATEATIARIFPGSRVLGDTAAKRGTFLQASGDFGMLYFGGHSVVNADFPLLSRMLFAKDPGDPSRGVLYSGDILKQRFPRTRLVALASCNTAAGRISRTEGVESLARPFLAAGVPSVIASLWPVDDQVTADFFVRFYRHLASGFDVPGALQAAQIESLKGDPKSWAGFEVIGGGVTDASLRAPTATASKQYPKPPAAPRSR